MNRPAGGCEELIGISTSIHSRATPATPESPSSSRREDQPLHPSHVVVSLEAGERAREGRCGCLVVVGLVVGHRQIEEEIGPLVWWLATAQKVGNGSEPLSRAIGGEASDLLELTDVGPLPSRSDGLL